MMQKIRKLILVSRPISWPNTAYPFAIAYLVAGGSMDLTWWLGTVFFTFPYNLLMYGVNDVFDYESDIKNPRKGGVEGMREQRAFHPTIMRWSIGLSLPFVAYFVTTGTAVSRLVFALVIAMVVAYSVAVLRFKERPVLDSLTSSSHFVGPMLYALTLTQLSPTSWRYVAAFFAWGMASHALGAVQDIIPDRQGKIASIATYFGANATVWFSIVLYSISVILLATSMSLAADVVALAGLAYIANCLPYIYVTDETSAVANTAWRRFLWLNYVCGFVISIVLILASMGTIN